MKKSLVLAMAMAMGVTASAYAANPFSDVPAGHWAYDAVAQLADAGVVEGYGASFGGDKLMTRYEMAQLVAKAMAKGGNCDKLAAEFADELDALGVKVAALEKKVDNVKITGQIRYSYRDAGSKTYEAHKDYNRFRTRLFVNGAINKGWKYTGMLENNRFFSKGQPGDKDGVNLKRAWLDGRVGGLKVSFGRVYFVQADMIDSEGDGVKVAYNFDKVKLEGWAFKNQATVKYGGADQKDEDRVYMAKASTKFGKLGAFLQYWKADCVVDAEIFELGVDYPVAKDTKLAATYFKGDALDGLDDNGWMVQVNYKGAKASKPGSWGLYANYQDRPVSTFLAPSNFVYGACNSDAMFNKNGENGDGYKGWEIGANYTLAKNIVAGLKYYDYDAREDSKDNVHTIWSELVFTF